MPRPEGYVGVPGRPGVGPAVGVSLALEIAAAMERPADDDFPRVHGLAALRAAQKEEDEHDTQTSKG
jgi:hypothetical protein